MIKHHHQHRITFVRWCYLGLALGGLVFPARRYALWLLENGLDFSLMASAATQNALSAGLSSTVFIVTSAAILFILAECRARRDPSALMCVPLILVFGVAFGLPLYLFLRQRRRD